MSAEDYSVGWAPATGERGHVDIESPQGTGAVDGHLDAALAVLAGIAPEDPSQGATYWELEVANAIHHLTDAQTQRRNATARKVRRVPSTDGRWNCAACGHVQAEHHNLRLECYHVTMDGSLVTEHCACPTFVPRSDHA